MVKGATPKEQVRAWKLKLKPTSAQKANLAHWAGCSRFLYNKTVAILSNPKNKTLRDKYRLRNQLCTIKGRDWYEDGKLMKSQNSFYNDKPWLRTCPKAVKQGAIEEARSNLSACFTNKARGNIKAFNTPFRTKKKEMQRGWSIHLEKNNVCRKGDALFVFPDLLGEVKYCKTKQLHKLMPNDKPDMDCKLQKDAYGDFYLVLSRRVKGKAAPDEVRNPVAGDPGIRKFLTTYSPTGEAFMLGNRWASVVMEEALKVDRMMSEHATEQDPKKRRWLVERMRCIRRRVHNLKAEMHFQCANFLVKRYDLVMLPRLDVNKLVSKGMRRLTTKTARALLHAGHCAFFDLVKAKCWEHGINFLHVREEYTTRNCPHCGTLNDCNGSEVYHCQNCGFKHDRDLVGSLNGLLKGVRVGQAPVHKRYNKAKQ